jgi:hypothetical protein
VFNSFIKTGAEQYSLWKDQETKIKSCRCTQCNGKYSYHAESLTNYDRIGEMFRGKPSTVTESLTMRDLNQRSLGSCSMLFRILREGVLWFEGGQAEIILRAWETIRRYQTMMLSTWLCQILDHNYGFDIDPIVYPIVSSRVRRKLPNHLISRMIIIRLLKITVFRSQSALILSIPRTHCIADCLEW